jgi:hypothetical protein
MKRMKKKYAAKPCDFCKDGTNAVWMTGGISSIQEYACEKHKNKINQDDGYMSEGDYQSWGRL